MADLKKLKVKELKDMARKAKIKGFSTMKKKELIEVLSKRNDDIPYCFKIEKDGEVFGYCLPQYRPGIITALFASGWKIEEVDKLGYSHRQAIKKLKSKPIPNTVVKSPPG